jgi:hypothetical protein
VETGRKHSGDSKQVFHHLFFWGKRLSIHHYNLRSMSLTKRFKPLKTEANQSIIMGYVNDFDVVLLNTLKIRKHYW